MWTLLREYRLIWLAVVGLAGASGTLFTAIGVKLGAAGVNDTLTGVVLAANAVGFICGALVGDRLVIRVGHIRALTVFAAIAGLSVIGLAATEPPYAWVALRFLTGFGACGAFLVVESWLNHVSGNANRGTMMALYTTIAATSLGLSPLSLGLVGASGPGLFLVALFFLMLSQIAISLTVLGNPPVEHTAPMALPALFRLSPLALTAGLVAGMAEGSYYGLLPVYGQALGLSDEGLSVLLALMLIGGIAGFPIGVVSDRLDRRLVLAATAAGCAVAAGLMGLVDTPPVLLVGLAGFLVAMAIAPLYGLALARLNDTIEAEDFVPAAAGFLLAYSIGTTVGPISAGQSMAVLGPQGLPLFLAAIMAGLAVFSLGRSTFGPAVDRTAQSRYVVLEALSAAGGYLDPRAHEGDEIHEDEQSRDPDDAEAEEAAEDSHRDSVDPDEHPDEDAAEREESEEDDSRDSVDPDEHPDEEAAERAAAAEDDSPDSIDPDERA